MYSVSETIEDENIYVTSHPSIWYRENTLLWPPEGSGIDRKNIVEPGSDWIPYKCKILRDNIETFEEALELETRYSKHRDSNSFRKEQERKQYKRDHPVNANISDLIDVNAMITKINAEKESKAVVNEASSKHAIPKKTVSSRLEKKGFSGAKKAKVSEPKKTVGGAKKNRILNSRLKSEFSKAEKTPRYPNYLKSGKKSTVPSSTITKKDYLKRYGAPSEETSVGKDVPVREELPSSTISKKEYLKRYGPHLEEMTVGKEIPVREIGEYMSHNEEQLDNTAPFVKIVPLDFKNLKGNQISSTPSEVKSTVQNYSFSYESDEEVKRNNVKIDTQFPSTSFDVRFNAKKPFRSNQHEFERNYAKTDKPRAKPIILEDVVIKQGVSSSAHRSASFEECVLRSLNELKNAQKKSEERQTLFEARMITKYDIFADEILQTQGRTQNRGQKQQLEPVREFRRVDTDRPVEEYFDDFDEYFPIRAKSGVEELEWNIRTDLEYKFRLKCRSNDFIAEGPKKTIRLIMKYLIQDNVLERFSWNGTAKKAAFKKLTSINNFLYDFVHENFKKYKKFQYRSYMEQWIKHAKSRQRTITYTYPNRNDETEDDEDDENEEDNDDDSDDQN